MDEDDQFLGEHKDDQSSTKDGMNEQSSLISLPEVIDSYLYTFDKSLF